MLARKCLFILTGLLALVSLQHSQAETPPAYIEVQPGTLPLLLTIPHGGDLKPASFLSRRYGVTAKDSNTVELGQMLREELQTLYGGTPHLVICRLHRSKLDCNRELKEAAQGDEQAVAAWKQFHHSAEEIEKTITRTHGQGLTLDLHGHRHEDPRVELGYLLPAKLLNSVSDTKLDNDPALPQQSSIRWLAGQTQEPFSSLIRGPSSLGAMLEKKGFPSLPSPAKPSPGKAAYFSGAYDIAAHGSRDGGSISAIQVECPWTGVRDTPANQRRFAKALAACLGRYFEVHFQVPLGQPSKRSSFR